MKRLLFYVFVLIPSVLFGQHAGGTFSGSDYVLIGETEIVLKDGSKISCTDKIDGTEIGKTNIDYKDVDYILLVKTSLRGFESHNGSIYKYIIIKNKPKLVNSIIETPKLSFYQERPKMTGGGYNAIGLYQTDGQKHRLFMIKDGAENAVEVKFGKNFKNIAKLFPDCPLLIRYQKDKKLRKELTLTMICSIYNGNCNEETSLK